MRNQATDIEPPVRHHVEHRLEIALLGPPYEAERIILPLLLVERIITTRSIRARDLETQLLLVEVGAGKLKAGHSHQNDAAAFATHQRRLMDRLAAAGRGGDDHPIHAALP